MSDTHGKKPNYVARGKFIVFDGIDGTGKGTLIKLCSEKLTKLGYKATVVGQPGSSKLGEEIRRIMFESVKTQNIEPNALKCLFMANQIQNTHELIEPALVRGEFVLGDRYWPSHIAYEIPGLTKATLEFGLNTPGRFPDLFFLLVGNPEVLLARANKRPGKEGAEGKQSAKTWNKVDQQSDIQNRFISRFGQWDVTRIVDTTWATPEWLFGNMIWPHVTNLLASVPGHHEDIRDKRVQAGHCKPENCAVCNGEHYEWDCPEQQKEEAANV